MKALKFVMITAIVSLAMISYAGNIEPVKSEEVRTIKVYLAQAELVPELVCIMYNTLTPDFLFQEEKPGLYDASVRYKFKVVKIYGTREAWIEFFRNKPGWAPID